MAERNTKSAFQRRKALLYVCLAVIACGFQVRRSESGRTRRLVTWSGTYCALHVPSKESGLMSVMTRYLP